MLNRDDSSKTILLFPGQGCQYVGMGQKLITEIPSTKDLFDRASAILEYDLLNLCLNGPKETLDQTEFCQPAVVVTSLAAVEALWETDETAVKNCVATAGFSVGKKKKSEMSTLMSEIPKMFRTFIDLILFDKELILISKANLFSRFYC